MNHLNESLWVAVRFSRTKEEILDEDVLFPKNNKVRVHSVPTSHLRKKRNRKTERYVNQLENTVVRVNMSLKLQLHDSVSPAILTISFHTNSFFYYSGGENYADKRLIYDSPVVSLAVLPMKGSVAAIKNNIKTVK